MAALIAKKAGLKLFEKHLQQYEPVDPLYETYADENGRQRRRKREIPPGLSRRDARILKAVKKRARRLDTGLNVCGFRVGWTFLFGLIPGAGDVLNAFLGYYLVVRKAKQAELSDKQLLPPPLPPWLTNRMLGNQAIATVIGFVPLVGDVGIAIFKTNSRNAALLEEYLRVRGEEFLKTQTDRVEDPKVVKPGAGVEGNEKVPGKAPSQNRFGFFSRSSKNVPTVQDTAGESNRRSNSKGKGKDKNQ